METSIENQAQNWVKRARHSLSAMAAATTKQKNSVLDHIVRALQDEQTQELILEANAKDLSLAKAAGLAESSLDRLRLNRDRLLVIASSVAEIVMLPDPVGKMMDLQQRPTGIVVGRMQVPLGLILMVYESRPNVTIDAAALSLKAGNAVILRGGKEALHSNQAFVDVVHQALQAHDLPKDAVLFVDQPQHELLYALLGMQGQIDLAIPRGGIALIQAVVQHAKVPVIQHYQGICHVYVEASADRRKAKDIVLNAKVQRPGVCNAMEGLIVDRAIAAEWLPEMIAAFAEQGVTVRACAESLALFGESVPSNLQAASAEDFDTEYLSLTCSLKIVAGFGEALDFIRAHGSQHSEAIVTENHSLAMRFLREVDASCVLINASTRFNDGGQLGLGAELGISTTKLHAYGPMGLDELCARKFIVLGQGEIRP
ncbi:MAG: glutamate-5-semialdehyde dehydrogenase [Oligoflexus sp.]